jgi:hypothetical protein
MEEQSQGALPQETAAAVALSFAENTSTRQAEQVGSISHVSFKTVKCEAC